MCDEDYEEHYEEDEIEHDEHWLSDCDERVRDMQEQFR